jgi:hypothetical protein
VDRNDFLRIRILLFKSFLIQIEIVVYRLLQIIFHHVVADPDPTFNFDANPAGFIERL